MNDVTNGEFDLLIREYNTAVANGRIMVWTKQISALLFGGRSGHISSRWGLSG